LGNNVWRQTAFNSRLQPCYILDSVGQYSGINDDAMAFATCPAAPGTNGSTLLELAYNWGSSNNNGDLLGLTGTPSSAHYTGSWSQSFGYDDVNRLTSASETAPGGTSWSRNFGYDAYGNLWISGFSGMGLNGLTPTANNYSNNKASNNNYDAAGNITGLGGSSGTALTYDAESRQIQAVEPPSSGGGRRPILMTAMAGACGTT
jgi:hypothetical protein